jgi:hypothetical protein
MWRCDYCRASFDDRDTGINHARARHSRDYTACRQVSADEPGATGPVRRTRWLPAMRGAGLLPHVAVAMLAAPLLAALRPHA